MTAASGAGRLSFLPGVGLALVLALLAQALSEAIGRGLLGLPRSPLSPVMLAIVLGMAVRNTVGIPAWSEAGVRFSLVRILRLGIVLLGLRLGLGEVGALGAQALPVIAGCVLAALLLVTGFSRLLGCSARLGTLIAVGTGICGSTAIVALSPAIRAREDETAYAVACITVFGMAAMLVYPFAAHALFGGDAQRIGVFLGTAVHDTAQVVGSGLVYGEYFGGSAALDAATVTKLVRNLGMLLVVPLLGLLYQRRHGGEDGAGAPWHRMVPLFVLGFAAMSGVRTLGDLGERPFGVLTPEAWNGLLAAAGDFAQLCLAVAMAAVGLGTSFRGLRDIGARPFLVGLLSAVLVGAVSFGLIRAFW